MPYIALDMAHNKKVISFDYSATAELKTQFPRGFRCTCGRTMHPKGGENRGVALHFAHNPYNGEGSPPVCAIEQKYSGMDRSDLLQHFLGQAAVYRYLKSCVEDGESVEIEVPIGNRRADVCIKGVDGMPLVAHEIQLSYQSVQQLEERTQDYESQEVNVVWWFGEGCARHYETQVWAKKNFAFHGRIEIGGAVNLANLAPQEKIIYTEANDTYNLNEVCRRNNTDRTQ